MNMIQEKLLADGEFVNQLASLVGVIADKLPSNGKLSDEIESFVNSSVEESMSDQDVDIGVIVDEKIEEYDMYDKVESALNDYDMSDKVSDALEGLDVVNEDKATEIANDALYDYDWWQVISDHDLLTRDNLDIDDKVEEIVDAKLFGFMKELMLKFFGEDTETWLGAVRAEARQGWVKEVKDAESTEAAKETEDTPAGV